MQDNATLQARLDEFLRIAKANERKQINFQECELDLLACTNLIDLLHIILDEHKVRFQLTDVTLLIHDPEYEFQRLLEAEKDSPSWQPKLLFTDSVQLINQYFSTLRKPRLITYSPHQHAFLFPDQQDLGSIALLPLVRGNAVIGSLNLGSRNPSRFQSDIGTQFLQHLAAVMSACLENVRLQEHIKLVGLRDPLTAINNRRFFDQRLGEEVSRAKRLKSPLSCMFIDLDHFKRVNDQYGHQAGDAVLKQVAQLLNERLRHNDILARYGGEEFVILLADTDQEVASVIAEQIRHLIAKTKFIISNGKTLQQTLSIGLATLTHQSDIHDEKSLIAKADQAVYAAKLSGRNRIKRSN